MFNLFTRRKPLPELGLLEGMADVHSHLLPGVDDGMPDGASSYAACRWLESRGVRRVLLTPHVMEELPGNRPDSLRARFREFLAGNPTSVEFRLAGEYMMDGGFRRQQSEHGLLTLDGRRVLVETSYMGASPEVDDILYGLSLGGYQPVVAHPERYLYMPEESLWGLKRRGCEFQLNLVSLSGQYGREVERRARRLLLSGFYSYAGSDLHSLSSYRHSLSRLLLSAREAAAVRQLLDGNDRLWRDASFPPASPG